MANQARDVRRPGLRTIVGIAILVGVIAGGGALLLRGGESQPVTSYSLIMPRYGELIATVSATGQIEPVQTVNVSFAATGRITEVLVDVGDLVTAGQPLAHTDTRELRLRLRQAETALVQARATYETLRAGATRAELAAALAQLEQARGQLLQIQGGVTEADLLAARSQLEQAQALLERLRAGPKQSDLEIAEARIREAELRLQSQRDQLSAAKTSAQIQLDQAANALTQAQSRYSTAKQNWEYVQATGADPIVRQTADPNRPGQTRPNMLNDSQRQQYYDAFVQAEAALRTAEENVAQAQVSYDNARTTEASGVELAEGQIQIAEANRDQLVAGADPDQIASARAQVAAARASLEKLGGDQRIGALQAAQAAVALAAANLEQLEAGPSSIDLQAAEAQVENAMAAVELAQLAVDEATLTAPFAGSVAEINLKVGEIPSPARPALVLTDLSRFYVNVTVDEVDISRIEASQPVTLTLDALPDTALAGSVESIAPLALTTSAVSSYRVRIAIMDIDQRVRPGMSANADIVVARKERVLLVPRRAVRNDRGQLVADIVNDPSLCGLSREQWPAEPALSAASVQTGLSNEQLIEIIAGLNTESCVYVEGIETRFNPLEGRPR